MGIKQTKALEGALARGMFSSQHPGGGNPVDRALLVLLEDGNCHATHILGKLIKSWEAYQIKIKIEQELDNPKKATKASPADSEFFKSLAEALETIAGEFTRDEEPMVNTGHLLLYILRNRTLASARALEMYNIKPDAVKTLLGELPSDEDYYVEMNALRNIRILRIDPRSITSKSDDEQEGYEAAADDTAEDDMQGTATRTKQAKKSSVSPLDKYGVNLTRAALAGDIDPVIGRDAEIERLIQILGRRKKNNPILIGEAGVGKSAIVEGLALRLAAREVPPVLYGREIFSLDVASMVAGTKYRGQFEERIKEFMKELSNNKHIILFIDEIHTIVGAGSTQGSLDAANILKPALARGDIQCIGATTLDEFRESIENDGALDRRFQKIIVEPTSKADTLKILADIKEKYEEHHTVKYSDEALAACVELADRYITDRHFPDKAIDILDEVGSKAHVLGTREPEVLAELEQAHRAATEEKRHAAGVLNYREAAGARMREVALGNRIREMRAEWQRERRLNPSLITPEHIRDVVSAMTGIPVRDVSQSEKLRLRDMSSHLGSLIAGQDEAISKVTRSMQRSRAGLKDPAKPIGVFMFVGPTGVGKTLLAKELSKWMFGHGDALVRIDMSEYSEKHNVSRLIGSPPGYVGYNEGGQLTEAVRRKPYSVVLFDEIEKAHPDVFNVMLQIFDDGVLTDGNGRKVDFRNTVIIMTSNAGSRRAASRTPAIGYGSHAEQETKSREGDFRQALEDTFAPEFINRIDDVVVFNTLSLDDVRRVVDIELGHLDRRAAAMGYRLTFSPSALARLAEMGHDSRYGVRSLKRIIMEQIEEPLAGMIVNDEILPGDSLTVRADGEKISIVKKKKRSRASA